VCGGRGLYVYIPFVRVLCTYVCVWLRGCSYVYRLLSISAKVGGMMPRCYYLVLFSSLGHNCLFLFPYSRSMRVREKGYRDDGKRAWEKERERARVRKREHRIGKKTASGWVVTKRYLCCASR
jgi:hypothetical protein